VEGESDGPGVVGICDWVGGDVGSEDVFLLG